VVRLMRFCDVKFRSVTEGIVGACREKTTVGGGKFCQCNGSQWTTDLSAKK
jgi:hypothetical protein